MISMNGRTIACAFLLFFSSSAVVAQKVTNSRDTVIAAGAEYGTSSFHQWLWGKNYRKDWAVPVTVPIVDLNTTLGGLKPVKAGGGNQTKSLQAETKDEIRYTFRTVNKTLGKVLPKEFLNTFIEDLVNDKVSMSHPYGAAVVPGLAKPANLFHTNPEFVFLPRQQALDTFNDVFANKLFLFEQKVDGDWKEADNLGNFSDYKSTEKVVGKMLDDNAEKVNQQAFLRARLFDMLINDWDRHEDQWEWGEAKEGEKTIYTAVPQDRDQAFFTYNGVLLKFLIGASGLSYFQPFNDDLKSVRSFNYEQRNLDRFFLNELTLDHWQSAASELQSAITDEVIDAAVKRLPAPSYQVSGSTIAATLKARRNKLKDWATDYYSFIAQHVDIAGSKKAEQFEVKALNDQDLEVNILDKAGRTFYSRTFKAGETKEVRLYGIAGADKFTVDGQGHPVKIRLIGGVEKDDITASGNNVRVYDNPGNDMKVSSGSRVKLSEDTTINSFKYSSFKYSKRGVKPVVFYSNEDRLFAGLEYSILTHGWRKEPFASKQSLQANYSISQKAFSVIYNGYFPMVFGKTDVAVRGIYDQVRWTNFFGLGNETRFLGDEIDFYRARTEEWEGGLGVVRKMNKHALKLSGLYQRIRVLNDTARFIGKVIVEPGNEQFRSKNFAGASLVYTFTDLNDVLAPTKGISLAGHAGYKQNLNETDRYVGQLGADVHWYVPLGGFFSLALRAGAETVTGTPEFYQYASIGGAQQLRAFRAVRYWGKTGVYNSNGLRYIRDVQTYLYNGKAGLLLFYDNGRVWMPGEKSDVWHDGYGFGIFLAPFNKISAAITYGFSRDDRLIQLRISRNF